MSLVELVIAAGLVSLVVALSAAPLVELKNLERRVEFQSGLDISHQLALQKARNSEFLKSTVGLTAGSEQEKCFTGRGLTCLPFNTAAEPLSTGGGDGGHGPAGGSDGPTHYSTPPPVETLHYTQPNGLATTSEIYVTANCSATNCQKVNVEVSTKQTGGATTSGWASRPLLAKFSVPASALAGRQEIDFSVCAGRVVTGVNYDTLKAECAPLTGSQTCNGVATGGPMTTFGQPGPLSPSNCQPPVNLSCGTGMWKFGMISGQSDCAPAMVCSDPMSPACAATPAPTPCVAAWSPDPNTVCAGDAFTQTDLNACPTSVPQPAVGTNAAICAVSSCTLSGPVRWPDPALGPCGVASASVTASAGGTGVVVNEQMGYSGTMTMNCVDNTPAASTFNIATAAKSCSPVVCTGLPGFTQWSMAGAKSGVAGPGLDAVGPWDCAGVLTITQSVAQPAGTLVSTAVDSLAKASSINSAASATSGTLTVSCVDPGPASAPRSGVLNYSGIACVVPTPTPVPTATPAAPYCLYTCIDNFVQTVDGRLEVGETSPESCKQMPVMLTKFSMGCNGFGTTCALTNPTGPMTQAVCGGVPVPVPTPPPVPTPVPTPPPACQPDGYMTGVWAGADDTLCTSVSSFAGSGNQPYALCCSGVHHPNYGPTDTVGGGNCNWTCGSGGPPAPTPAPTPVAACDNQVSGQYCATRCFNFNVGVAPSVQADANAHCKSGSAVNMGCGFAGCSADGTYGSGDGTCGMFFDIWKCN